MPAVSSLYREALVMGPNANQGFHKAVAKLFLLLHWPLFFKARECLFLLTQEVLDS
eukprot:c30665_g1_i1 orf=3-167(-)